MPLLNGVIAVGLARAWSREQSLLQVLKVLQCGSWPAEFHRSSGFFLQKSARWRIFLQRPQGESNSAFLDRLFKLMAASRGFEPLLRG